MTNSPPPRRYNDLIRALLGLFNAVEPETPDEVEGVLREAGYDPDDVASRMAAAASQSLAEASSLLRSRTRRQIDDAKSRRATMQPPRRTRAEMLAAVDKMMTRLGGQNALSVRAHYRNLETARDEDLASLLTDLEYLSDQSGHSQSPGREG